MTTETAYSTARERLEDIVLQVRSKDMPLEKSLDLYDEALALGAKCVELLEQTDFTAEELSAVAAQPTVDLAGNLVEGAEAEAGAGAGVEAGAALESASGAGAEAALEAGDEDGGATAEADINANEAA